MARTTAAEVKEIMDGCSVSDVIVTSLITAASDLVTQVFSGDTSITDTLLEEIERWLTAHMIASSLYRSTKTEGVGDASVSYTGNFGEGLKSTPYGQMVLTLDFTGKLAKVGKQVASIYAITSFDD